MAEKLNIVVAKPVAPGYPRQIRGAADRALNAKADAVIKALSRPKPVR